MKTLRTAFAILILSFPAMVPSGVEGASLEELYQSSVQCQKKLEDSAKLKKYRHNWESCIRQFEKLLGKNPEKPFLEESLYRLGSLYAGLYRYSNKAAFIEKAIEYFFRLNQDYPESALAKRAEKQMSRLNRSAPPATVTNIRHWIHPDYTRLVLDLNRSMPYKINGSGKKGVNIHLDPAQLSPKAKAKIASLSGGPLAHVKIQQIKSNHIQVNVPAGRIEPKVLSLSNPPRLVVDLFDEAGSSGKPSQKKAAQKPILTAEAFSLKIKTIVIDAGHGGKDPGAMGRSGLTEKEIVLDIALRLRELIQSRLGKKVVMTRTRDNFVPLDKRTAIANSKKADLFISIHANSHPKRSTRGVEIYHLGQSTDKRARAVAARENNVSVADLDSMDLAVKQILFDLGRDYNNNQSQELAHATHRSFNKTLKKQFKYPMVDLGVKKAPFYVLLNSDMPSILAEVSFISNPTEEKLLRQKKYRQAIAESLFQGIRDYLKKAEPIS